MVVHRINCTIVSETFVIPQPAVGFIDYEVKRIFAPVQYTSFGCLVIHIFQQKSITFEEAYPCTTYTQTHIKTNTLTYTHTCKHT